MLPEYLAKARPNPMGNRGPWYANTAPTYAGIFLWVAFYNGMAGETLRFGSLATCLVALAVAGFLCYALYYRAPAMLGMKTGYPLYVVGSSTFGTKGGYLMPGILMGLLQIGWFAVATFVASQFIVWGMHLAPVPGPNEPFVITTPFIIAGVVWGLLFSFIGAKGIQYVSKVATFLNFIPLLMLLIVFFQTVGDAGNYTPPPDASTIPHMPFAKVIAIVIGFFATAGAAGADFGTNSRHEGDVKWGGLVGITLAALIAAGLPLIAVAGAHAVNPSLGWNFADVINFKGGSLGSIMFLLFAVASIPATCFCAFIAGNSLNTMIPSVPRVASTMCGAAIGIILAVTGVAASLISFFTIIGASFGPICGAIAADYLLSGKRWSGPRQGINFAGYIAWAVGFVIGILPFLLPEETRAYAEPAPLYAFIAGFVVYFALAKAGLQPPAVEMPKA